MYSSVHSLLISSLILLSVTISSVSSTLIGSHPSGAHSSWLQQSRAPSNASVTVLFAIKQKNTDLLTNLLNSISNPQSPHYGQYLTLDEVHNLTSQPILAQQVVDYIDASIPKTNSLDIEITRGGGFVRAQLAVADAEKLLNTHYYKYNSKIGPSRNILRATKYTVPQDIAEQIQFVGYVNQFPSVVHPLIQSGRIREVRKNNKLRSKVITLADAASTGATTLTTINRAYNIDSNTITNTASTAGVFEDTQNFSPKDLAQFETKYGIPSQTIATVVGQNDPLQCFINRDSCGEASLDIQYLVAVAQGAPQTFYAVDPNDQQPFLDWLIQLDQDTNAPWVNSVSYGQDESAVAADELARFETEIQKLGVRGITVVVASGDDGVASQRVRQDASLCGFSPSYPATSPFVTAVGATQGPELGKAEVAESSATGGLITSGGGFSRSYPAPAYQQASVAAFLAGSNIPPLDQFTSTGRGYPDVSLLGHNYQVIIGGRVATVSGTSASAPVFAGLIALINSARFDAGKKSLGFVNPALYQLAASQPAIFNDIVQGENRCAAGASNPNCCTFGFTATQGWDAVTGLGSINFVKLKAALLALP